MLAGAGWFPPNGAVRRSPRGAIALGLPGGAGWFPPNGAVRRSPRGAIALGLPGGAHSFFCSVSAFDSSFAVTSTIGITRS
jgi:hypothetical protein